MVRADLSQGQFFRYAGSQAKPGIRQVVSPPAFSNRLYAVRLHDGELMVCTDGSVAASGWSVEVVENAAVAVVQT